MGQPLLKYLDFILVPLSVAIEVVHGKERLRVPVLGPHVVLLLPDLLQLILGHRVVRRVVLLVLLLLKLISDTAWKQFSLSPSLS